MAGSVCWGLTEIGHGVCLGTFAGELNSQKSLQIGNSIRWIHLCRPRGNLMHNILSVEYSITHNRELTITVLVKYAEQKCGLSGGHCVLPISNTVHHNREQTQG